MKSILNSVFIAFSLFFSVSVSGQSMFLSPLCQFSSDFTESAAVFYNNKILACGNSSTGKCRLTKSMTGKLNIRPVESSEYGCKKNLPFKIAVKDSKTNTIWFYSEEIFHEIKLEDILSSCQEGDKIIFMTVDRKHALPNHEVEIVTGC